MGAPGFWDDQKKAAALSAEHARLSKRVERYDGLASEVDDLEELLSISSDEELDELDGLGRAPCAASSSSSRKRRCSAGSTTPATRS